MTFEDAERNHLAKALQPHVDYWLEWHQSD